MQVPATTPIIIGVGEVKNGSIDPNDAIEPFKLMVEAIQRAVADASISESAFKAADSISVVPTWTWAYPDLPSRIAQELGIKPKHLASGYHGGNQPALQCDEAARRIALGESKLAIITGGEALASLNACQKAGQMPPAGWSQPDPAAKTISTNDLTVFGENVGTRHSMGLAIQVYPMYENALRAHLKQTQQENTRESAELYAAFDKVACAHPYSWRSGKIPRTAAEIGSASSRNRLICSPYTLLMNAFNTVNLAAACILTSVEHAESLGIPRSKWVYVLGGAGTGDKQNFWERSNFHSSQSLEQSIDAATAVSGLTRDEIDYYDFYSCFPIVPKLACHHLGLSIVHPQKPITLLGGLTSFGGAGNNYSMHASFPYPGMFVKLTVIQAILEMTRQLRAGKYRSWLILANGGCLTHHHAICLSSGPRKDESLYPPCNPLPEHLENSVAPLIDEQADGEAFIETYTVEFGRQGQPRNGFIIGRLKNNGHRFVSNHGDDFTLFKLANTHGEPVGQSGIVSTKGDGKNVFTLSPDVKL